MPTEANAVQNQARFSNSLWSGQRSTQGNLLPSGRGASLRTDFVRIKIKASQDLTGSPTARDTQEERAAGRWRLQSFPRMACTFLESKKSRRKLITRRQTNWRPYAYCRVALTDLFTKTSFQDANKIPGGFFSKAHVFLTIRSILYIGPKSNIQTCSFC